MKYRLGAAITVIAFTLLPGALLAGSASETVLAKEFDADAHTVTGVTSSSDVQQLRHTTATVHDFVDNPLLYPPGPYRTFALEWNLAVFQNKPSSNFDRLLLRATELGIALHVERTDEAGEDGSFELVKIAPSQ